MTAPPVAPHRALRRWVSDPVVPAALFAAGATSAAVSGTVLTWALLGGLAGYTLSGSV